MERDDIFFTIKGLKALIRAGKNFFYIFYKY